MFVAEELRDVNLVVLAQIHQSEMFRRRGWYEAAFRCIGATEKYIQHHNKEVSKHIQGIMWKSAAITYFCYGDEQSFLRTIGYASAIAEDVKTTVDTLNSEFDTIEVLQTKAQGYTQLWQPEKALAIYKLTDTLRPVRATRDLSSYHIVKAQAYCYVGDMQIGPEHARTGLKIAEDLRSTRYVIRLLQMSDRLRNTPIGRESAMIELREEILETLQKLKD